MRTHKLNLLGKKCPIPILKITKKYKEVFKGDIIHIKTDDPKAENDVEELAKNISIEILKKKKQKDYLFFEIQKL